MFDESVVRETRTVQIFKTGGLVILGLYVVIALMAGYRAWYQVHSLELQTAGPVLQHGSTFKTTLVSYARTPIEVRLELIQGNHAETLGVLRLPDNTWAFIDPRSRQASQDTVIKDEVLDRFENGSAHLRATATGRPQWTRLPPPTVRDVVVEIQRN